MKDNKTKTIIIIIAILLAVIVIYFLFTKKSLSNTETNTKKSLSNTGTNTTGTNQTGFIYLQHHLAPGPNNLIF